MTNEITEAMNIALQNIASSLEENQKSEFNGYTIADSMGFIADAMVTIAESFEKKDTSLDEWAQMQRHIVDLTKEEA
jgi:hypothetical protein